MRTVVTCLSFLTITVVISCISPAQNLGEEIYAIQCENCHQADGKGLGELIPDLNNSSYFDDDKRNDLVCLIQKGKINHQDESLSMPPARLSSVEMTNLLNFLEKKFSKEDEKYSLEEVNNALEDCN